MIKGNIYFFNNENEKAETVYNIKECSIDINNSEEFYAENSSENDNVKYIELLHPI